MCSSTFRGSTRYHSHYLVDNDSSRWGQSRHWHRRRQTRTTAARGPRRRRSSSSTRAPGWTSCPTLSRLGDFVRRSGERGVCRCRPARARADAGGDARVEDGVCRACRAPRTGHRRSGPCAAKESRERVLRVMRRLTSAQSHRALHLVAIRIQPTWLRSRRWSDDVVPSRVAEPVVESRTATARSSPPARASNRALEHGRAIDSQDAYRTWPSWPAHVFARARHWQRTNRPRRSAARSGMRGRLIVPSSFTRKFLLLSPLGHGDARRHLRTWQTYWAAPLDPRTGSLLSPEWIDLPLSQLSHERQSDRELPRSAILPERSVGPYSERLPTAGLSTAISSPSWTTTGSNCCGSRISRFLTARFDPAFARRSARGSGSGFAPPIPCASKPSDVPILRTGARRMRRSDDVIDMPTGSLEELRMSVVPRGEIPGQDGSPREAGQRDAVTSEADSTLHARGSDAQPR